MSNNNDNENYIEYNDPDTNKVIRLYHKADFYAFKSDFLATSGLKLEMDPPCTYFTLPDSNTKVGVYETGLFVPKPNFNDPEVIDFEDKLISYENQKQDELIKKIKGLLITKECEFLDFKYEMYYLLDSDENKKDVARVEFLKDILSIVNNKKDIFSKDSYLLIGIDEKKEKFTGNHKNINFNNNQVIIQIVQNYIKPSLTVEIEEYFIKDDYNNFEISLISKQGYNRNLIIHTIRDLGVVYEIKKQIGKVRPLNENDSLTRDGSHSRRISEEDRIKIRSLDTNIVDLQDLFQKFYDLLKNKNTNDLNVVLEAILDQIGKLKIQEILKMRYGPYDDGFKVLLEHNRWVLSIEPWKEVKIVKLSPTKRIFSFNKPTENNDILQEFLGLIIRRSNESGIRIIK